MFTKTEKGYLILTLAFLAAGTGIKAYRHAAIRLGPFKEAIGKEGVGASSALASGAEKAGKAPAASDSSLARQEAGPDSQEGADSLGGPALPRVAPDGGAPAGGAPAGGAPAGGAPAGGAPDGESRVGYSSGGVPDSGSASPGSVKSSGLNDASASNKASGSKRTARSGANKSVFTGKIDLNRADASELSRLAGVGAKTAQAIVDYRRAHGPYRDFRDLLRIKGIGEKKLEKLMPNLIL